MSLSAGMTGVMSLGIRMIGVMSLGIGCQSHVALHLYTHLRYILNPVSPQD
jgi:hypothetical protein